MNGRAWEARGLSQAFAGSSGLLPAEVGVLANLWPRLSGGRIVDVGVGGGRTVPYFSAPARRYIALDLSHAMIEVCRAKHPGTDVRVDDARELATITDSTVDVVLFSFNGIDYVPPEERSLVYRAARRVLRPGGAFAFSSHNLRSFAGVESPIAPIVLTANPIRMVARFGRAVGQTIRSYRNSRRLRPLERRGQDWALLNDGAYASTLLTMYVDPAWQVAELERAGFAGIRIIGERGLDVRKDTTDKWP
ncbi:MAG: class I SAM-dependent methyltransferase, partial [Polyangiaceae bacterium]|nr:class I SAM-dependent methyltransferase [Polyangiaceae bacterium]